MTRMWSAGRRHLLKKSIRGQTRRYSGEAYMVHLEAVAGILRKHGVDAPVVLAAAYLHDTVEDTATTIEEIYDSFGEEIAELVYWLTDAETGRRKVRKLMSAWRLSRAPWNAKLVKLADLADNSADICRKDRYFAPVYLREKAKILELMVKAEGRKLTRLALFGEAARIRTYEDYLRYPGGSPA